MDAVTHADERINYQLLFKKYNPVRSKNDNKRERIIWVPKDWYYSFIAQELNNNILTLQKYLKRQRLFQFIVSFTIRIKTAIFKHLKKHFQ